MVGLNSIKNFAQNAMERAEPLKNMTDGAFQDLGMAIADKTGIKDAISDIVAAPVNVAKSLMAKKAPAPTAMEKAVKTIQSPTFIGGAALTMGALYTLGKMTATDNADKGEKE